MPDPLHTSAFGGKADIPIRSDMYASDRKADIVLIAAQDFSYDFALSKGSALTKGCRHGSVSSSGAERKHAGLRHDQRRKLEPRMIAT